MRLNADKKSAIYAISLHLELIMWGDDFLQIERNGEDFSANWVSICEGGDISDKGTLTITKQAYEKIVDYLFSIDFSEQEDKEMNLSWEIRCFDENDDEVVGIPFGYWNKEILSDIIDNLKGILRNDRPFSSIINTINA